MVECEFTDIYNKIRLKIKINKKIKNGAITNT